MTVKTTMHNKERNWDRRNIVDASRVDELVGFYEEIGFEVMVKDFDRSLVPEEECNICLMENVDSFKIIYTRKRED